MTLVLLLLLATLQEKDGTYSELSKANTAGQHAFAGDALGALPATYEVVTKSSVADGELAAIRITTSRTVVLDNIVIRRNGRQGTKDLSKDTIVMSLDQISKAPKDLQAHFAPFERMPAGLSQGRPVIDDKVTPK